MAKDEKLFAKVFRGFSPDEVIAYIDELNAAHRSAKSESDARINSLTEELTALKAAGNENDALKDEIAQRESVISEKDEVIAKKDEQIARLENDAENQRLAMVEQSEKMSRLEENVSELKSELEAANIRNVAMEKNSKEYESMLADVESILASSRRKAEELIAEAEKRAAEIVATAEKDAKVKSDKIISESDEHLNENLKKVKYLYRRQDELAEIFRDHKAKVDSFFSTLPDISDKN